MSSNKHSRTPILAAAFGLCFMFATGIAAAGGHESSAGDSPEQLQEQFAEAVAALDANRVNTARRLLKSLVGSYPTLQRARLELARAHYLSSDYESARAEAQRVLDDPNTPPTVRTTVLAFLAQINEDQRRFADRHQWVPSIYLGAMYDSNVNFGVERDVIDIGGVPFNVSPQSREIEDVALVFDGGITHTYNPGVRFEAGERTGFFVWQSQLNGYYRPYFDEDQFNLAVATLRTGPVWFVPRRWTAGLGLQADQIWLGSPKLALFASVNPNVTWYVGETWELTLETIHTRRDYDRGVDTGRDGWHHWAGGSATRYFQGRKLALEGGIGYAWLDADDNRFSYDGPDIYVGLQRQVWQNGTVFGRIGYRKFDFDGVEPLFNISRDDDELRYAVGLLHDVQSGWLEGWLVRAGWTLTDNDSNVPIFEFDRHQVDLGISRTFR